MSRYDIREDKPYRRGLLLGLTMAEVMILLIFLLLMALASSLAARDRKIEILGGSGGARLVETLAEAYPAAKTGDDYFKELRRAIDARQQLETRVGGAAAATRLLDEAEIGREAIAAARAAGADDPAAYAKQALAPTRGRRKGEWPPFFSLSEAGGYYFDSGKATLRPDFESNLRAVVIPQLAQFIADYEVDVVEVIGHTDEVPMVGVSNLDKALLPASANRFPIEGLQSTDNAGLAIARAVSVVRVLRADSRLTSVTVLPLSGAQLIVPVDRAADGRANGDDQSRRRIEIRLRRSTDQVDSQRPRK